MYIILCIYFIYYMYIIYDVYDIWDQKEEITREIKLYINGENNNVENKTGILYNDTVDQLKGM